MSSATFNSIATILQTEFRLPVAQIQPQTALADLGLDSLALMEFVFAVEGTMSVRTPLWPSARRPTTCAASKRWSMKSTRCLFPIT